MEQGSQALRRCLHGFQDCTCRENRTLLCTHDAWFFQWVDTVCMVFRIEYVVKTVHRCAGGHRRPPLRSLRSRDGSFPDLMPEFFQPFKSTAYFRGAMILKTRKYIRHLTLSDTSKNNISSKMPFLKARFTLLLSIVFQASASTLQQNCQFIR